MRMYHKILTRKQVLKQIRKKMEVYLWDGFDYVLHDREYALDIISKSNNETFVTHYDCLQILIH